MTCSEIVREIRRLPSWQQQELQATLARLLKQQELASRDLRADRAALHAAARALLADYQADAELTAFTALDSDDFHATR